MYARIHGDRRECLCEREWINMRERRHEGKRKKIVREIDVL